MQQFVAYFWGCYFGTAALMFAGSVFVFTRQLQRIGANAALSAVVSAFFSLGFLGGLPIDDAGVLARFLAHLASEAESFSSVGVDTVPVAVDGDRADIRTNCAADARDER